MIELDKNIEQNFIDVKIPAEERATTQIYNRLGITLKTIESQELMKRIDISDIPEGIYFIKVQIGDHKKIMRFIKN